MSRAPVFGDPAKDLQMRLQAAMDDPSFRALPGVSYPPGTKLQVPPMAMTPERIAQQNAVIQRLEGDWAKGDKAEKTRIEWVIRSHLRDFPGTTSKLIKGARRRKTRGRKSRKMTKRR